jgi:hypothetical protein
VPWGPCIKAEGKRQKEGSTSFLKKRSKKLLLMGAGAPVGTAPSARVKEVFCFFFSKKKRLLTY